MTRKLASKTKSQQNLSPELGDSVLHSVKTELGLKNSDDSVTQPTETKTNPARLRTHSTTRRNQSRQNSKHKSTKPSQSIRYYDVATQQILQQRKRNNKTWIGGDTVSKSDSATRWKYSCTKAEHGVVSLKWNRGLGVHFNENRGKVWGFMF